jgi:hypothetical protein
MPQDREKEDAELFQTWQAHIARLGKVDVPTQVRLPHQLVANLMRSNQEAARGQKSRDPLIKRIYEDHDFSFAEGEIVALNALIKALEKEGLLIAATYSGRRQIGVSRRPDEVYFTLERRMVHLRTRLSENDRGRNGERWKQTKTPTNHLRLRIQSYTPRGVPDVWDGIDGIPLEAHLAKVVAAILVSLDRVRLGREENETVRAARQEREDEATRLQRIAEAEAARRADLQRQAERWKTATTIREFVAAAKTSLADKASDAAFEEWARWALTAAEELDPLTKATFVRKK